MLKVTFKNSSYNEMTNEYNDVTYTNLYSYHELSDDVKEVVKTNESSTLNYFNEKYNTNYTLEELHYAHNGRFIGMKVDQENSSITWIMRNETFKVKIESL